LKGHPHPQLDKGVHDEHCEESLGCDVEFTTTNYNIKTTPKKEYGIAKDPAKCREEDKKDKERKNVVRHVKRLEDLERLSLAGQAKLMLLEILVIVSFALGVLVYGFAYLGLLRRSCTRDRCSRRC
jgi:hypothetical protein